jgi:undecaprenyl-diphosphatase
MNAVLQALSKWDDRCLLWVNQFIGLRPGFDSFVQFLSNSNEVKFGLMVAAIYWLWFRESANKQRERGLLSLSAIAALFAMAGARLLTILLPFRPRPFARPDLSLALPADFETGIRNWSSFPSDHAVMAFALATGIWLVSKRVGTWAFLHAIFVICLPRFYLGLHHPTDLIVGAMTGIGIALLFTREVLWLPMARQVLYFELKHPAWFYVVFFLTMEQVVIMFGSLRTLVSMVMSILGGSS